MKKHKIGIFGGTFNPIHTGHLILAENAYNSMELEKVYFMPTGVSYLKNQDDIAKAVLRSEMVKLAIKDNDHFDFSSFEIEKKGNTYTCETLSEIQLLHPDWDIYFIMGADSLFYIENWLHPEIIFEKATLVAVPREDMDYYVIRNKAEELIEKFNGKIELLDVPNVNISSSMIRERVINKQTIKYYVPKSVEKYIFSNDIYKL